LGSLKFDLSNSCLSKKIRSYPCARVQHGARNIGIPAFQTLRFRA
jgi:hypothetical protein